MKKLLPEILAALLIFSGCTGNTPADTAPETEPDTAGTSYSPGDDPENITEIAPIENPFKGLPPEEVDTDFSPLVNKKAFDYQLFCYDGNGNIYFANPADGFHLYVYDGRECKAVSDIPACSLGYDGGYVYFLTGEAIKIDDIIFPAGYPRRYDPGTGETQVLGEERTECLTVIDGKMYCLSSDAACYVYDYESGERLFDSFYIQKTGDFFLTSRPGENEIGFYLESGDTSHPFIMGDIPVNPVFSYGKCFYIDQNTHNFKSVDMKSGSVTVCCTEGVSDFTLLDGQLYIIGTDGFLYRYDEVKLTKLNETQQFECLYSDNVSLYGVGKEYSLASGRMEYFFVKFNDDFSADVIGRED